MADTDNKPTEKMEDTRDIASVEDKLETAEGKPATAEVKPETAEVKPETAEGKPETAEEKPSAKETSSAEGKPDAKSDCDPKLLDLAFGMDCTGSMGSYIHQACQNIRQITEEIVAKEQADVRLALVEYRDHPPQDSSFVTRPHDFTGSVREMKGWLEQCSASGGGDGPEAVADALHQILKLNWRPNATKICVFISDAPPHGLGGGGDGFPNGCPDGLDPMVTTKDIAEKGITLYVVGCEPSITPYKEFFSALAHMTSGQYVPLKHAKLLTQVIVGGAQEEISLQKLMDEVQEEVRGEAAAEDQIDEEVITRRLHVRYQQQGVKSKKLWHNKSSLPQASAQAQELSDCTSMADIRSKHKVAESQSMYTRGAPMMASRAMPAMACPEASHAKKSRSRGGVSGFISGLFTSKPEPEPECEPAMLRLGSPMAMDTSPPERCESMYEVAEDEDIDAAQVSRMVHKAVMMNKLNDRRKKTDYSGSK